MPPGFRPQNLNDVFFEAAKQARQKPEQLTHNQKVRSDSVSISYLYWLLQPSLTFEYMPAFCRWHDCIEILFEC
jgi:hypothetical protein